MAAVVCLFWQTARGDGPIGAKELKKFLSLDRSQKIMIKPKVKAKIFEGKSEVNVETVGPIQSNHLRLKLKRGTGCLKGNIPHTNAGGFDASHACQEIKKYYVLSCTSKKHGLENQHAMSWELISGKHRLIFYLLFLFCRGSRSSMPKKHPSAIHQILTTHN